MQIQRFVSWIYQKQKIWGITFCLFWHGILVSACFAGYHYPWQPDPASLPLVKQLKLPEGYRRVDSRENSFGDWLRKLPIKNGNPAVYLHNGSKKMNQIVHYAVVDIDTGTKDLQQCADAVIRLRAEYFWALKEKQKIAFKFTSGDLAKWQDWANGMRPKVNGSKVIWQKKAAANDSYQNFRRYLETVFMYAGSYSLAKELKKVFDPLKILPGDVFIQGGFPGHAVIVLDVAQNPEGERIFVIAQSYMPAQDIHILKNPKIWKGPWYNAAKKGMLITPEWVFDYTDLKRF